jgi:hypothetical protein
MAGESQPNPALKRLIKQNFIKYSKKSIRISIRNNTGLVWTILRWLKMRERIFLKESPGKGLQLRTAQTECLLFLLLLFWLPSSNHWTLA